jgi:hypothetical protein
MSTSVQHLLASMVVPSVLMAACAGNQAASTSTPSSAVAEVHPDTKAEPGNCDYYNYYHNEARNTAGPSKCATDCDCDGMRSCKAGTCEGQPRPLADCNSPDRRWNEAWNPQGAGKCSTDCECDGKRTCQAGTCQGVAR